MYGMLVILQCKGVKESVRGVDDPPEESKGV